MHDQRRLDELTVAGRANHVALSAQLAPGLAEHGARRL